MQAYNIYLKHAKLEELKTLKAEEIRVEPFHKVRREIIFQYKNVRGKRLMEIIRH